MSTINASSTPAADAPPSRLSALRRKATTLVSMSYAMMVEYRAEILLWAMVGLLPLLLMGVWAQIAATGKTSMTPIEFVRYFMAVFIIGQFTTVWVAWEFESDIVEGRLSPMLLQPLDPGWRHVAMHIGERGARLPVTLGLIALFALLYPAAAWWPGFRTLGLTAIAVVLAFTLRFTMQYTTAMLGFWTERASAIESLNFLLFTFLAGRIAPIAMYPETMQIIVYWLPFPYVVDFPATIILGKRDNPWPGFAVVCGWIVVFFVINRVLWKLGLKKYSGMGA